VNNHQLKVSSFAKINRYLRILGKRPDGYHEIDTVLETVSLHDELTFTPREDDEIILHCDVHDIPSDNTNLIVRAAEALNRGVAKRFGVNVDLVKRIPAKGGLGGASSNAAVTILALNHLWNLRLEPPQLIEVGKTLGSDVPFFFVGGVGRGRGRGEDVSALPDVEKSHLIIITPNAKVSTAHAYQAFNAPSLTTQGSASILSSSFAGPAFKACDQSALHNDFEGVIFEIEPEIERAKQALLGAGAQGGLLAGSGSSVFGIFADEDDRERALGSLKCEDGWQIFSCDTVSREEYSSSLISSGFPLFTLS
jgi:4-diphosphocytidyl-2-C-methyl-D-erythritol kinase